VCVGSDQRERLSGLSAKVSIIFLDFRSGGDTVIFLIEVPRIRYPLAHPPSLEELLMLEGFTHEVMQCCLKLEEEFSKGHLKAASPRCGHEYLL
jgi:hypothetical protein